MCVKNHYIERFKKRLPIDASGKVNLHGKHVVALNFVKQRIWNFFGKYFLRAVNTSQFLHSNKETKRKI